MKRFWGIILTCSLLISSIPAAFATSTFNNDSEKLYATESTTIGDVMRFFDLATYNSLSSAEKEIFDSTYVLNAEEEVDEDAALADVEWHVSTDTPAARIHLITGLLDGALTAPGTGKISYISTFTTSEVCLQVMDVITIYDSSSGEIVGYDASTENNSNVCGIVGVLDGSDGIVSGRSYRAVNVGSFKPYNATIFSTAATHTYNVKAN